MRRLILVVCPNNAPASIESAVSSKFRVYNIDFDRKLWDTVHLVNGTLQEAGTINTSHFRQGFAEGLERLRLVSLFNTLLV